MKGVIITTILLLLSFILSANPVDSTVTSFEIHLKRKADNPLGFNTCNIDRAYIYNLVIEKLQKKLNSKNFHSLHNPLVLMKFVDVCGKDDRHANQVSDDDKQLLNKFEYEYFIRICGELDIDKTLNHNASANFKLKVYVFDAKGNLIAKSKSKSREKNLLQFTRTSEEAENYPVNEQEFFQLVNEAADSLNFGI
jgi:hypothetical protein